MAVATESGTPRAPSLPSIIPLARNCEKVLGEPHGEGPEKKKEHTGCGWGGEVCRGQPPFSNKHKAVLLWTWRALCSVKQVTQEKTNSVITSVWNLKNKTNRNGFTDLETKLLDISGEMEGGETR